MPTVHMEHRDPPEFVGQVRFVTQAGHVPILQQAYQFGSTVEGGPILEWMDVPVAFKP